MTYFVIVRGPLGVGKSTVAEFLAKELGAEHIAIDRILEDHSLEEWDEDRNSDRSFLRANGFAIEQARPLLERGQPVVLDGNSYWRSALEDMIRRLPFPHFVFTLGAPLSVCLGRDRLRPTPASGRDPRAGERMGEEATAQVYSMVMAVPYGEPIDAAGSVEATVEDIRSRLPEA